ncbi:MAG: ATP phosphoribosyltransferase regulatory subunit [Gammaproteobacteria bacterium WSBS_2016_MAG_OTU1]
MAKFLRLPAHLSDLPPPAAGRVEGAHRAMLDYFFAHNYQLHLPALAEYADSLSADDETLQLDIFKMTDTLSGRTLGIRADHTPQTARFDAASGGDSPRRLCYCGPALRTHPPQPWKQRELMQIGAEIFNLPPPLADWEIIHIAAGALAAADITDIAIDIGHAGILLHLLPDSLSAAERASLCRKIARQDAAALRTKTAVADSLIQLTQATTIEQAKDILIAAAKNTPQTDTMLAELASVVSKLQGENIDTRINFGEIGGYGYHTGIVFTIYGDNFIAARGGRYDRPGFRPATGFSADLREIVQHLPPADAASPPVSCPPPPENDSSWFAAVADLLRQNRRIQYTTDAVLPVLEKHDGKWQVRDS